MIKFHKSTTNGKKTQKIKESVHDHHVAKKTYRNFPMVEKQDNRKIQ